MQIYEMIKAVAGGSTILVIAVLTLIQISPLKINPWNFIGKLLKKLARKVGQAINSELFDEISSFKEQMKNLEEKFDGVETKVQDVKDDISETKAIDCRTRIHHFGDEVLHNVKHTKEHFDEILRDIKTYDKYCDTHPDFPNHTTELTSKRIIEIYGECLKDGDFL